MESEQRVAVLRQGVAAVVEAMASERQFSNGNEGAFALLRRGCKFCEQMPEELEAIGEKDVIAAFLQRTAGRRAIARQVQEVVTILARGEKWHRSLAGAMPPVREYLAKCPPPSPTVCAGATATRPSLSAASARLDAKTAQVRVAAATKPPPHEARVFLRERVSGRFLTVVAEEETPTSFGSRRSWSSNVQTTTKCIMTSRPVSLLVCHWASEFAGGDDRKKYLDESSDEREFEAPGASSFTGDGRRSPSSTMSTDVPDRPDDGVLLGFAHEGVTSLTSFTSLGCFVSCRPWCRASLRSAAASAGPPETLQCSGHSLGRRAAFRWCEGGGLRHAATRHWLYVDPALPERATLHEESRSWWEALPAV